MIRVGIGGWTYKPWRGSFYPSDLRQKDELAYAAARLGAIEINGTFYRAQKPESFAAWREAVPEGFVFAIKGHRAVVSKREPADAGEALDWFLKTGVLELGDALGPFLWQLPANRSFDPDRTAAFLDLLPESLDGRPLRHAVEAGHESFYCPAFVTLLSERGIALVTVEKPDHPMAADLTAPFAYARLQATWQDEQTGYAPAELDRWAARARTWAEGRPADDLPRIGGAEASTPGDVFLFMIGGAKVRAPAAAVALIDRLGR